VSTKQNQEFADKVSDKPLPKTRPKKPEDIEPGCYDDIPFEEYRRIPAINFSTLKLVARSLAHYRWTARGDESPALAFGSLTHVGKLEPELLMSHYVVIPEAQFIRNTQRWAKTPGNRTGKSSGQPYATPKSAKHYKDQVEEFMLGHPGKQEVSVDWWNNLQGMLEAMDRNKEAKRHFGAGRPEVTIVWIDRETGLFCKGRIDWVNDNEQTHADLKTFQDVDRFNPYDLRYNMQAAMYQEGFKAVTGWKYTPICVAVEKQTPFSVMAAPYSRDGLELGREDFRTALRKVAEATKKRRWPGPQPPRNGWAPNKWYEPIR
jgi:hypothetical protein